MVNAIPKPSRATLTSIKSREVLSGRNERGPIRENVVIIKTFPKKETIIGDSIWSHTKPATIDPIRYVNPIIKNVKPTSICVAPICFK